MSVQEQLEVGAQQTPSTAVADDSKQGKLPVMEIFGPTIQGEGGMIGVKTMFIRFGGCDYRCSKCDSMHAVEPAAVKANARWLSPGEIVAELNELSGDSNTEWVTLSGGNPAVWDMSALMEILHDPDPDPDPAILQRIWKVAVETQGTVWRDWLAEVDHLTISPKGPGMGINLNWKVHESFLRSCMASVKHWANWPDISIKVVVFDQQDFEFVVAIDKLLDDLGERYWPRDGRYLSLGNAYQPVLGEDLKLHDQKLTPEGIDESEIGIDIRTRLLKDYKILLEDYLQDSRLAHWKFLPQLHVLVWANKSEV